MIVALAGGVGGARLANGLAQVLGPGQLTVGVNVGDDFEHLGLKICPDIDTVTYTLAGRNNVELGWGVTRETWSFMDELKALGGPDWFNLGDRDLAKHVLRTEWLRQGRSLSDVTADLAQRQGVRHAIVPVSDERVQTMILTEAGELPFQEYFVLHRHAPRFLSARYDGADTARMSGGLAQALASPDLQAIVICPSNPVLSIAPILAVKDIAKALQQRTVPCVAVSPFIAGEAVKGPAAKIMRELGREPGAATLADFYSSFVDAIICDAADEAAGQTINAIAITAADTFMNGTAGQHRLAEHALAVARSLA